MHCQPYCCCINLVIIKQLHFRVIRLWATSEITRPVCQDNIANI